MIKHTKLSISEKTTGLVIRDLSLAGILICGPLSVRLVLSNMLPMGVLMRLLYVQGLILLFLCRLERREQLPLP